MLWADQTNSAEILVSSLGAIKAGVSLVTFDEKESIDALSQAIRDSGCRGILFSPETDIDIKQHINRRSLFQKLMPELHQLYPGDPLNLKNFP